MFVTKWCRILLVSLISVTFFVSGHTQLVLKGRISDAVTNKPIPLVNVFLSNTSVGTITDENGKFTIQRFPDGRYDLIVSCIGYETYIVKLQSDRLPADLSIKLSQKVNVLQEVIVEPYEKNGWEKWGKFFVETLIGTSSNSADCKLMNKETIKFRYNKKKNILSAFADEPIIIENNALGYVLKYALTQFTFDYTTNNFVYEGYPFFTEMETKRARVKKRWEANREDAYYGSLMHFMRSLYRNKLAEDHFEVRKLIKIPEEEKARIKKIYQQQMHKLSFESKAIKIESNMGFTNSDSALYYKRVMQTPEDLNILIDSLLPGDSIAYAIDSTTVGLDFKDYLQVIYLPKKNPAAYARYMNNNSEKSSVTSQITITNHQPISVLANGTYFQGLNLLTIAYWGWWEKLGNLLPYGYWPPSRGVFYKKESRIIAN